MDNKETPKREINRLAQIERSIIKKYRKSIWAKFVQAIDEYQLIQENDKIAVCISGGKDSMLMAKLFQELQKHWVIKFEAIFLVMDPGYNEVNRKKIEENAEILGIPLQFFETDIFNAVFKEEEGSPCYLCARMRRGYLYREAKERGCNKIALGHHFDDAIETTLMGMLYGGQIQTMIPKLKSDNVEGMELIRPMYKIKEEDIYSWTSHNELEFIRCACRFTDGVSKNCHDSKRNEMKELIKELRKVYPLIDNNIFKSMENVNVNMVLGYKIGREKYSFLDRYEQDIKKGENNDE